ncbi:hypothetical protein ACJIZ3_014201 [Penstemon smallii]|uniref:Uncharacterized protein n=1 Tax=Penstemon smallii TaxID=265156 RepID=A0ABD3RJ70_9LAMI
MKETEYEQVRIVRIGQLRVIFNTNLKIRSWEFCAQNQIEYIHRNSITPQVTNTTNSMIVLFTSQLIFFSNIKGFFCKLTPCDMFNG